MDLLIEKNIRNRILYLDIARGLAVFFMVMQHAMIMHEKTGGEGGSILGGFFILMGTAPAAPVFLLIMGLFLGASKSSVSYHVKRGLLLFFGGYVLNFFRFVLPLILSGQSFFGDSVLSLLGEVDIFQLAGLSLILFSPLKNKKIPAWVLPVIAVAMAIVSPWLWGLAAPFPNQNPFWGTGENVSFPFFPWGFYTLLGMYLSPMLATSEINDKVVVRYSLVTGAIGFIAIIITPIGDYYRSGLGVHFLISAFVFAWLLFCNKISLFIERRGVLFVKQLLTFWSRRVTAVYVCQWLIYGFSILPLGYRTCSPLLSVGIGFAVMLLSSLICYFPGYLNAKTFIREN